MTRPEFDALLEAKPEVTPKARLRADGFVEMTAGPCPYLAENRCSVYAVRPLNCRRFMCGRMDVNEPLENVPVPMKVLTSRDLRRQYALNQRRAMARWGMRMGWTHDL